MNELNRRGEGAKTKPRRTLLGKEPRYTSVIVNHPGDLVALSEHAGVGKVERFANFELLIIGLAYDHRCSFDDLCDAGGLGDDATPGYFSMIRESSKEARAKMLCRALNFLKESLDYIDHLENI